MNRTTVRIRTFLILPLAALLFLSGCISASRLLEKAEQSWSMGFYAEAIQEALDSYEKAADKNKNQSEIDSAENFLVERFPQFNENLSKQAENQLKGTDSDKEKAWETYQQLVNVNSRVGNSMASSFLSTEDFSAELRNAKDVAAQIKYVKALELMGLDERSSYIEATGLLLSINDLVSGYRDIGTLLKTCYDEGTLIVAFSDRNIYFNYDTDKNGDSVEFSSEIDQVSRDFIERNDYPDFLKFITAGSVKSAEDAGAVLFVDYQGDIGIKSEVIDSYLSSGTLTWKRTYEGTPTLLVTRIGDTRNEISPVSLGLSQSVTVEFYPVKYDTQSITGDMYYNQFNNSAWMADQLNSARVAMDFDDWSATLVVWAEMQYGGVASFLSSADVSSSEGNQVLPIDEDVYKETQKFINKTLPDFLEFSDMDVETSLIDEMFDGFLSKSGVRELLTNLDG